VSAVATDSTLPNSESADSTLTPNLNQLYFQACECLAGGSVVSAVATDSTLPPDPSQPPSSNPPSMTGMMDDEEEQAEGHGSEPPVSPKQVWLGLRRTCCNHTDLTQNTLIYCLIVGSLSQLIIMLAVCIRGELDPLDLTPNLCRDH